MEEVKSALLSRTVWAALIGLGCSLFGLTVGLEDQGAMAEVAVQLVGAVSAVVAIYGRVAATKRIG